MPNIFYVQLREMQEPCKIKAEKIEERGTQNAADGRLVLKNDKDEVVGDFKSQSVVGWWKQFD
jgi:hypothetical protein